MGNNTYKWLGVILIIFSGMIYTAERITEKVTAAIIVAGYASHGTIFDNPPSYLGFFSNFFVWFCFLIGFVLLVFGFPKNKDRAG